MRRVVVIACAVLLPVFVLGCGGGSDETTAPETVEGQGATTPTEEEATTQEEEGGGGGAEGDAEAGQEVFASAGCGNCHIFEPAGSEGTVGPNLDDAQLSFEQVVEQVRNGGGGMPAFEGELSDKQIADVAAFVTSGR
ncbi:MAG TPA: cytochrome c [Gaiellaceae bacterium]|nr:cytochrome c [Gaiellaceae bacterium]